MSGAALQAFDLTAGYATRSRRMAVLSELNFAVHAGEMVCLLGPNGIGKSTLLRTLSGLQPPLAGSVELGGVEIGKLSRREVARKLGIVLTERPMVGALNGREMVELGRYSRTDWTGRLTPGDHSVVDRAIQSVGAQHLAQRDINRLSDGERQRLMIARAVAQEPLILILDEPTAFLDVASRVEIFDLLRRLTRQENLAVVISTHDLELALRMADMVWLIKPGGRFESGVQEDLIVGGHIEAAFPSERIRFFPERRAFRPLIDPRGCAAVNGQGLGAAMACAILEREGYAITTGDVDGPTVFVDNDAKGWKLVLQDHVHMGTTFAEFTRLVRGAR